MWNHFKSLKILLKWKFEINKYLQFESIYKLKIFEIFRGKLKLLNSILFTNFVHLKIFQLANYLALRRDKEKIK